MMVWRNFGASLDVWSLRYEYGSIYSRIMTEWLTDSDGGGLISAPRTNLRPSVRETKAYHKEWMSYVFKALQNDQEEMTSYLVPSLCSTTETGASPENLRKKVFTNVKRP